MNTELLHLSFRLMTEKTFSLSMKSSLLISDVKVLIKTDAEIAPENQRLIFKGQLLKDDCTLKSYGVESGSTIHVVGRSLQSAEPDVAADSVQAGNDESGERTDAPNPDSQPSGATNRGLGMPMGLFMSPIYATISVSTPVTPNTSENSMEQVATQFFSGVVNSLLSSFTGSSSGSAAQNPSNPQASQPQDELVMELDASTGVLKRVSNSVRALNIPSRAPNDTSAPVANDSPAVPEAPNQLDSSISFNSTDSSNLLSVDANSSSPSSRPANNNDKNANNLSTLNENDFEVIDSNDIFRPVKRSNSEVIGNSRSKVSDFSNSSSNGDFQERAESRPRSNSMPESLYDIYNFGQSTSNDLGSDPMQVDKSTSVPHKKSELSKEFEEYESRRSKVLLTDPELVTSKLPWDSLNRLESVYESNSSYNLEFSSSRRGAFVRRPYNKIELSSPCYLSDESVTFDPFIGSSENMERSRGQADPEDPESLSEFLYRLESVNNKINNLIRLYDSGDRATQIELYKSLSTAMAVQTRIYSSLCAIFSWMHTQMVSPDSARRFSNRMGWEASSASPSTPLLPNGSIIQTPMGNFSFATFTSDGTRIQTVSTEGVNNADPAHTAEQSDTHANNPDSANDYENSNSDSRTLQ